MTKDDIELLYAYDRWANDRIFRTVSALTPEQFIRDLGGSFPSVRDTLVHIIRGEWIWIEYWKAGCPGTEFLSGLRTRRNALFRPELFPSAAALESRWREVENEQIEFVSRVIDESLGTLQPFRGAQVTLAHLMQHMANHSTYHRGQISLMLRQLGSDAVPTDFHVFLVETISQATA